MLQIAAQSKTEKTAAAKIVTKQIEQRIKQRRATMVMEAEVGSDSDEDFEYGEVEYVTDGDDVEWDEKMFNDQNAIAVHIAEKIAEYGEENGEQTSDQFAPSIEEAVVESQQAATTAEPTRRLTRSRARAISHAKENGGDSNKSTTQKRTSALGDATNQPKQPVMPVEKKSVTD